LRVEMGVSDDIERWLFAEIGRRSLAENNGAKANSNQEQRKRSYVSRHRSMCSYWDRRRGRLLLTNHDSGWLTKAETPASPVQSLT